MKSLKNSGKAIAGPVVVIVALTTAWYFRAQIFSLDHLDEAEPQLTLESSLQGEEQTVLEISEQARKKLGLVSLPALPTEYWRSVLIPGEIADRPGYSDRGVISPAVGIVTQIHAFPGDTMRPGESLFTLRLFSEYLQATQTQLYKSTQETEIVQAQIDRLSKLASVGGVAGNELIQLRNEISRQETLIRSARQELLTRGLTPEQIAQIEGGKFVSTVEVKAPEFRNPMADQTLVDAVQTLSITRDESSTSGIAYEVQELSVELGQQVQSGQLLAKLSNHHALYVIGRAFKGEAAFLEDAAQDQRPIQIEFTEDAPDRWPELNQRFEIRHLSNSIDTDSRTFDFFIPLTNQSHAYQKQGEVFLVWRFRPGQRTRIHVPVEKYDNVIVLPAAAVVRNGPEAYVFRQNGDLFKRLSVYVLHEDRKSVVIANDGSVPRGSYLAQNAAASLHRVLKAQSASGEQPGLHVHPDGTVHAAH